MTDIQTNGSDELAVKAAVEHHVSSYQRVVSERDELQRQNDKQEQLITVYKIENEGLRAELAAERSRTASYQNERDVAVTERAEAVAELKARHDKAVVNLDNIRKILEPVQDAIP